MAIKDFYGFINETIRAEEAHDPVSSLRTLLPDGFMAHDWTSVEPPVGRRKVCFIAREQMTDMKYGKEAAETYDLLLSLGFKALDVRGGSHAVIVHHPTAEAQAKELRAIAERYGGMLHYSATREETKRIGELLEYDPRDIKDHLDSRYGPISESRDWALWVALAASIGVGSAARASTPADMARVVDTVRRKTEKADYMPEFERARARVRAKVVSSPTITNKAELLVRLDSVEVREYSARSTTMMYYLADPVERKDYIFVNTRVYLPEIALGTFVHELNHLVDRRKKVSVSVPPGQVFLRPSYREYQEWFAGWPDMTWIRGRESKPIVVGRLLANSVSRMRGYLHQPHEVYARMSSLKDYLVREGYMRQGELMQKHHVDSLIRWAKGLRGKEYHDFMENDFVVILPMIDWRCLDEINLFAAGPGPAGPDA